MTVSVETAVRNYLCRGCTRTINLRKLSDEDRRRWFACGYCSDCLPDKPIYEQPRLFA